MAKQVEYFFAPVSGYAYLGHAAFLEIARRAGAEVILRPFDIIALFSGQGTVPPPKQGDKRLSYRQEDMARWATRLGLPLNAKPAHWPANPGPASRAILATEEMGHDAGAVAGAFMTGIWAEERNLADAAHLAEMLDALGLPAADILAKGDTPEIVAAYEANTARADALGVFGSPTFVIDGVRYYGQDRLDFVAEALVA
ncbi:MAG: 2-hydroxychromene-2-carboxylate isomerase [Rhodobacteraceae bacterium]|nr:2-hydroxychromene-2-carboxylate isomerase [Paracoccaceae bacterium]